MADVMKGSMVDPQYWQQQYFLADKLKKVIPDKSFTALEVMPKDAKHLGYLCRDKEQQVETGFYLDCYYAMGQVTEDIQKEFERQGEIFSVATRFVEWKASAPREEPWRPMVRKAGEETASPAKISVDVALFPQGMAAGLGPQLGSGLKAAAKVLKYDGRLLLVATPEDEEALGGKLETLLESQDLQDLEDMQELVDIGNMEAISGQVLRLSGLRLMRVVRGECDLAIGVCFLREDAPKSPAKAAKARRPAAGRSGSGQAPARKGPPTSGPGRPKSLSVAPGVKKLVPGAKR